MEPLLFLYIEHFIHGLIDRRIDISTIFSFYFHFSRDCPIFYMRKKAQKDLTQQDDLIQRFGSFTW